MWNLPTLERLQVPNCKGCKYEEAKLKCLICEQAEEIDREKNEPRYYSEVITPTKSIPFSQLDKHEKTVWVLHLANFTEKEIAIQLFVSQQAISYCIAKIKGKLSP